MSVNNRLIFATETRSFKEEIDFLVCGSLASPQNQKTPAPRSLWLFGEHMVSTDQDTTQKQYELGGQKDETKRR
jgi:hypothetical protein